MVQAVKTVLGARVLLSQIREAMAETLAPQARLDKLVHLIAQNLNAQVCSFYILRDDEVLELFATVGLKPESVHKTSLRLGEGLVGMIAFDAQPLNLTQAQNHPKFVYRPETGEEAFHSFLGVPVLRAGQTLGVLTIQNMDRRVYTDEEVDALLTVATLLAEMMSTAEFDELISPGSDLDLRRARHFDVDIFSEGLAVGHVVLHDPRVVVTNFVAEDQEQEAQRLEDALKTMRISIDDMIKRGELEGRTTTQRDVFETYRMFAHDRSWVQRMHEAIASGLTAEAAIERVQNDTRARMMRQTDPYIRDRLHDLDDLANRLLRVVAGSEHGFGNRELASNTILVARNMGPAELLDYDLDKVVGLVLEEGAMTTHVSIVARSMGLVSVGQAQNIAALCEAGDQIIIDGVQGHVYLRPQLDVLSAYQDKIRMRTQRQEKYKSIKDLPSVTKDGVHISILLNSGLLSDMLAIDQVNAAGVGLFRTELKFMIASQLPRLSEQVEFYAKAVRLAGERPITFRLLDIGGDKLLPYMRPQLEENPAMGWRSLRLALERPGLFRTQIRALLEAACGKGLNILVPMVTETSEFLRARELVDMEVARFMQLGRDLPHHIRVGAMIEVPSILFELDSLLPSADFLCVGSNDLLQFLTAADRTNQRVSRVYDPLSAPRIRVFKQIACACHSYQLPLTMCGELANRPMEALALMAVGFDQLSMSATAVGPVRELVRHIHLSEVKDTMANLLDQNASGLEVRHALSAFLPAT